jgi:hypothetical protein
VAHNVKIKTVRRRFWDDGLRTTVVRTVGHRAECECGERSKVRRSKRELRTWARAHHEHVTD